MAKYCPIQKRTVLYLECIDCEEKEICHTMKFVIKENNKNDEQKFKNTSKKEIR